MAKSSRIRKQKILLSDATKAVGAVTLISKNFDGFKGKIFKTFFNNFKLPAGDNDVAIIDNFSVGSLEENEKNIDTLHGVLNQLQLFQQVTQINITKIQEEFNKTSGEIVALKMDKNRQTATNEDFDKLQEKAQKLLNQRKNEETFLTNISELIQLINGRLQLIKSDLTRQYKMTFAERLRQARQAAGLRQQDLAEKIERNQNGFTQLETAVREPDLTTLARMAKILNVSTDWLLGIQN